MNVRFEDDDFLMKEVTFQPDFMSHRCTYYNSLFVK